MKPKAKPNPRMLKPGHEFGQMTSGNVEPGATGYFIRTAAV
jgi:hypothetical protein